MGLQQRLSNTQSRSFSTNKKNKKDKEIKQKSERGKKVRQKEYTLNLTNAPFFLQAVHPSKMKKGEVKGRRKKGERTKRYTL